MKKFNVTLDQLRYLYLEEREKLFTWVLLAIPSLLLSLSFIWIGWFSSKEQIGNIYSIILSVALVLLAIWSFMETFPMLPSQVIENKMRYKRIVGWAYLGLSAAISWYFFDQIVTVWKNEPAGKIAWMPEVLAVIGIGGAIALPAILIGIHKPIAMTHLRILDAKEAERYQHNMYTVQEKFREVMTYLAHRVIYPPSTDGTITDKERAYFQALNNGFLNTLSRCETNIVSKLTTFSSRVKIARRKPR